EDREALDSDRARARDAAEIVALEVDDHRQLGAVLRAQEELARGAEVLLGRRSARRSALDRPRARAVAVALDEELGRGGEQRAGGEAAAVRAGALVPGEEARVGPGVRRAQAPVEVDGIALHRAREAMREVRLVEVAGRDALARALDPFAVD